MKMSDITDVEKLIEHRNELGLAFERLDHVDSLEISERSDNNGWGVGFRSTLVVTPALRAALIEAATLELKDTEESLIVMGLIIGAPPVSDAIREQIAAYYAEDRAVTDLIKQAAE